MKRWVYVRVSHVQLTSIWHTLKWHTWHRSSEDHELNAPRASQHSSHTRRPWRGGCMCACHTYDYLIWLLVTGRLNSTNSMRPVHGIVMTRRVCVCFCRALLQKGPIIWRSLLIVATPYSWRGVFVCACRTYDRLNGLSEFHELNAPRACHQCRHVRLSWTSLFVRACRMYDARMRRQNTNFHELHAPLACHQSWHVR